MSPQKVSLQVAHAGDCPNAGRTALESTGRGSGCTCQPSYYTFQRDAAGKRSKGPRVRDRRAADRMRTAAQAELDAGRSGIARPKAKMLYDWLDEFERNTESRVDKGDVKPRTLKGYRETIAHVRAAIEDMPLRELGTPELRALDDRVSVRLAGERRAVAPASRLRHLRQFSAALGAAVDEGHLDTNPLAGYMKKLAKSGVRAPKRGKAPFEDEELERLVVALENYEPVYRYACRFAAETGLRLGELVALDWKNVADALDSVYVEHTYDEANGLVKPKDREPRWVYLTPWARAVLEEWFRFVGEVRPAGPVFPNPLGGGRLVGRTVARRITTAMEDAGIEKVHPKLRQPRSWHSLRYTTSNLLQRRGYHPRLIEATLGHSSLELTYGVYGGWTPEQLAAEANRDPREG